MSRRTLTLPSRQAMRDHLTGLDQLYRPATEAERILDEFGEGASVESLRRKYPGRDVDVILRRHVWPADKETKP